MNKKQIIDTIEKYKLDKSKFIVISGAALVLLEQEEKTKDIDIWCDSDYCEYMINNYNAMYERTNELGKKAYLIDNIINFGVSFKPNNIEIIESIKCASLRDILELKMFLNRDKDTALIRKLKKNIK
jgi:hypothetical protein